MPIAELDQAPDDVAPFLKQYRATQQSSSGDDGDDVGQFLKTYRSSTPQQTDDGSKIATPDVVAARATKDGTSTGTAVENLRAEGYTTAPFPKTDPRSHDFGWSKDEDGNWTQDPDVAARDSAKSTIPIIPFQATVPTTPLSTRAANLGQPSIQLEPPPTDTSKVPLNVFSNQPQAPGMPTQEELPTKAPLAPPQNSMDQIVDQEQAFEGKAHQQGDELVGKLATGSKNVPLPYFHPDGSLRTMKLGDFQKLADDYMNDPSIPKSQGAAFAAGAAADTVKTLNDIFFSPLGIASTVTGLAAARALQLAGKQGAEAIRLGQQYQEMQRSGASAEELAEQEMAVRRAVASTQQSQGVLTGAKTLQKATGVGFGIQGAGQVISGVQRKDYAAIASGLAAMAMGGSEGLRGLDGESIASDVKSQTAQAAADNLNGEETARVPVTPPGEKNVTAQGSHEIVRPAQLPAPAEESPAVATPEAATPSPSVGAGEELTPEKPETIQAQVDALAKGTNPIVYIPKGQENAPEPPNGAQVTEVAGDKPGAGTYYHDDSITPQEIKAAVKDGTYGQLLGNVQSKEEATGGTREGGETPAQPVAVTARDDNGNEVQSSLVAGNDTDAQAEQSAKLSEKFPNATVGVETPEQVVSGRLSRLGTTTETLKDGTRVTTEDASVGKTIGEVERQLIKSGKLTQDDIPGLRRVFTDNSERYQASTDYARFLNKVTAEDIKPTESAALQSLSRETPQAGEGDADEIHAFVQQHREASSVIQPQRQELRGLASTVKDIDPHTADALNGLADGRYFSREDLLKIAGGIRNAKTANELRAIVNEYSGSEATPSAATASAAKAEASTGAEATKSPASAAQSVPEHAEQLRGRAEEPRAAAGEGGNQLEAPKVGDYVSAKSGSKKGMKMRVTKVGATGVYGADESTDGGPIRFLKNGEFGPLLDNEGKPITTGPGTPLRDAFDTTGTRIQQLAQTIRENVSGSKPISDRMDYADKIAEQKAKAKDEADTALAKVKGSMAAMWDAYSSPPKWTDYEDALGKYQGAIQKSAFGLRHFAQEIKKAVSDPKRREAITNYIEAAGNREMLQRWADQAKPQYKAGYKAALDLTNVEQTIARNIIATQDERFELDKAAGLLEHEVDNYVMHAWKRENPYTKKLVSNVRAQMLQTKPSFTKQRVFGTFFDGEKAGYAPVNKDIGFLFAAREHAADQAIAARTFIKSMLDGKAEDGRPLVAVSGSGRPLDKGDDKDKAYFIDPKTKPEDVADYRSIDHPALRKWTWATNDGKGDPIFVKGDLVVHSDAYGHLKNVLGKSALRSFAPFHAIQSVSSHFKSTLLSFSMFHQTQESLHALFHRVNPFATKPIDFSNPIQSKLIDHGLQVASFNPEQAFGEGLGAGVPNRLPIVGKYLQRYNDYLFGDFIPRLKMGMAEDALKRNLKRYQGKLSQDQIYAQTANEANAAFGELNYTMMGRNKTMQDVLRMALLAPDFLEARGRFVGQALKPYGREQAIALILGALGLYTAARILNQLLTGNPRWEAQNAFNVVYKGRAYTLRSVPADIMHLFTDPRGFVYNRLNPIYGKAAIEGITGRDQYGRKQSVIQEAKDVLGGGLPIPIQGLRKESESGPLDTALSSAGVSTFRYKSPAERLAQQYTLDTMPLGEESKDRKDANQLARELEDKLRKKEISPRQVRREYEDGKITASDRKRILARAARTPLQNSFRSLTPQQAIQVWDRANDDERKQIRPLLANKLSRMNSVPQNEREKLKERIVTALHGAGRKIASTGVPMYAPGA